MLEIFVVCIDLMLARFDRLTRSLRNELRLLMLNPVVFLEISANIIKDLYTNNVNLPNEKRFSRFVRS